MRGILEKMLETGCIRAFITLSRRSAVTMSRRRLSMVMLGSDEVACKTWLRVRTNSPELREPALRERELRKPELRKLELREPIQALLA